MMRKVINGCPYCGSKEGFEQKVVATYYLLYTADGIPDTATYEDDDQKVWMYPRCMTCGRKVIIEFEEPSK